MSKTYVVQIDDELAPGDIIYVETLSGVRINGKRGQLGGVRQGPKFSKPPGKPPGKGA